MADNKPTNKIVLCKMFTGDYWEDENNLGYETINMFLPDNSTGESYIYLPASGDYDLKKHKITKVLLVRSIPNTEGKTVQILGKADVVEELLRCGNKNGISSCTRGSEFVGLVKLFQACDECGELEKKNIDAVIDKLIKKCNLKASKKIADFNSKDFTDLAIKLGFKNKVKTKMSDEDLRKRLEKEKKEYNRKEIDKAKPADGWEIVDDEDKEEQHNYWYAIQENLYNPTGIVKDGDAFEKLIEEKCKKVQELREIFTEKKGGGGIRDVTYAKIPYDKIFEGNDCFGQLNICASLKVNNLWLVPKEKTLYLTTEGKGIEDDSHKYICIESVASSDDGNHNGGKLSATSQKVYLPEGVCINGDCDKLWNCLKKLEQSEETNSNSEEYWFIPAEELKIDEGEGAKYLEDSYLTVSKHEYDELTYSNLFAYFFKKGSNFVEYFFKNVKDKNGEPLIANAILQDVSAETVQISDADWGSIGGKPTVNREERNIDIVLNDTQKVIVVENKIKSALNGAESEISDSTTGNKIKCKDQLIRYYSYIEDKYQSQKSKYYFIFAPDYNHIEQEEFGWGEDKNGSIVQMKNEWKIVRYSMIFEGIRDYKIAEDENLNNPFDKKLFEEFLKALYVHTDSSANNYYRQMQKRLLRIKNKQGEKNEN